jgi:hypothetical protein
VLWILPIVLIVLSTTPTYVATKAYHSSSYSLYYDFYVYTDFKEYTQIRSFDLNNRMDQAFYSESPTQGYMSLIVWSPTGEYLIFRSTLTTTDKPPQYCVLTRQGKLQSCLSEPATPVHEYLSVRVSKETAFVQWHQGRIWYLSESGTKFYILEADPITGETLRTIFELNVDPNLFRGSGPIPSLAISPDGSHILVGAASYTSTLTYKAEHRVPAYLHDLKSGTQQEISLEFVQNTLHYTDSNDTPFFCGDQFTPSGKYLVLRSKTTIFLLDKNLKLVDTHPMPTYDPNLIFGCPEWSADESVFYVVSGARDPFTKHPVNIYSYDMRKREFTLRKSINDDVTATFDYSVSPDGKSLALTLIKNVYGKFLPVAHILTEFDELIPLQPARHLVWSPLLITPGTPQPPPNIILPPAQPTLINPLPGGGGE